MKATSSHPSHLPLAVGVDFGGTSVKIGLASGAELTGPVESLRTSDHPGPKSMLRAIADVVDRFRQAPGGERIRAIGMGVPGVVDHQSGICAHLTNVEGWNNLPLRDLLQEATGLPAAVDNDANCATNAEWRHGAAKGHRHVIVITLGTGVGGGLVLDGHLYRGATFAAGEIGHVSVDFRGVPGPHGNVGALERYVGNRQIVDMARHLYSEAGQSEAAMNDDLSPRLLAQAATKGDAVALEVWDRVSHYLATALAGSVYLLNPEAIVIGGGVAQAGAVLFEPLQKMLFGMLPTEFTSILRILPARYGNTAGIIGSAALGLEVA